MLSAAFTSLVCLCFFFFNDTATTEIYTLSLHDALPISRLQRGCSACSRRDPSRSKSHRDRKSTRLNSSHLGISYAVFCLKKKKEPIVDSRQKKKKKKSNKHSNQRMED